MTAPVHDHVEPATPGRWIWHGLAGALFLAAVSVFVGFDAYFFIDEAAYYGQMEVMDDGGWTTPRPFTDADPTGEHVPMAHAHVTEDGFAPFVKHPLYVGMAFAGHQLAGEVGVRLLSSLGVLAAAGGIALLAGRRGRGTAVVAFWLTLLASPLLFHAQLVIAHGLGAAVAAALLLVLARAGPAWTTVAVAVVLTAVGAMLRSEFLLFGGAVGLVTFAEGLRWQDLRRLVLGVCVAGATVVTHRLEPVVVEWLVGGEAKPASLPSTSGSRESGAEVLAGARRSILDLGGSGDLVAQLTLVVAVLLAGLAVVAMSAREPDRGLVTVLTGGAAAAAALHLVNAHLVRGLVWAFPAVLALVPVLIGRVRISEDERRWLTFAGVFAVLVVITQYSGGGGDEWGWRYTAIALPAVIPVLSHVLVWLWERRPLVPKAATAALVATFVLVTLSGVDVQRVRVSGTDHFLDQATATVERVEADYVVFTDPSFGRFAYPLTIEGDVAAISAANSDDLLRMVARAGSDTVLLVWRGDDRPDVPLGPFRATDEEHYIASAYRAVVLTLD